MIECTETILRNAASWKAFKEGKALFENGSVLEAKIGSTGWQGSVRSGKRPLRVTVNARSATDLETRCPCPENQSTGALCAHAVAVGLAALAPRPAPVVAAAPAASLRSQTPAMSYEVIFPPNFPDLLARERLTVTLSASQKSELSAADLRLAKWLLAQKVVSKPTLNLHLDAARLGEFLDLLLDHDAVLTAKSRAPVAVASGARIPLSEVSSSQGEIHLRTDSSGWSKIGGAFWIVMADSLMRIGQGKVPDEVAKVLAVISSDRSIRIPQGQFLSQLDSWQEWLHFPEGGWLDSLHFVPAPCRVHLALEGSLQHLEAKLRIHYGDSPPVPPGLGKVVGLPKLNGDRCEVRDASIEEKSVNRLIQSGFEWNDMATGCLQLKGEKSVVRFFSEILPLLKNEWEVAESDSFKREQKKVVVLNPRIEILGSGEDWLSFDLRFQTSDGVEIPVADVRSLLRSGNAGSAALSGKRPIVSTDLQDWIDPLFSELEMRQEGGHYRASAKAGELVLEIQKKLSKGKDNNDLPSYLHFIHGGGFTAKLRDYQTIGAGWLHERVSRFGGALLADDMGLGKTIQTIALIERLQADTHDSNNILVVATASLLGNWKAEFGKFAPGRMIRILHGTGREKEREKVEPGEVILTSYGTLSRDLAWHLKREYQAVVVDEASLMRNPDTDHAKAISKLRSQHRVALTGTPVENGVKDLWSIFRFIQPGWLGTREEFKERYELPLAAGEEPGKVLERLRLKTAPFLLRRTKEQVAPELPGKIFIDEFCDLSPDQQGVYKELLVEGRKRVDTIADSGNKGAARMQMLTALLRLRQTCCDLALLGNERFKELSVARRSAKLDRLLELIEEAVAGNHRMLIFSQFQTQLKEIETCIASRGWDSLRLDGQTRKRQEMVDRFQKPDGPPVFLISLKAGGYGLNLTAADTVVHFDPWWNPAAEAQATDRAHRIGQTRPVTVYRLLTRGTVEEKVVRLQTKKRELAAAIDENGAGDASGWSMDELMEVMR